MDIDPGCKAASFTHLAGYEARQVHILLNQAPNLWVPDYAGGLVGFYFQTRAYDMGLPVATGDYPPHFGNPTYFEDSSSIAGSGVIDDDYHECYVARAIGVLQINADGDYRFSCSSDDGGALFLSTDDRPAHKTQIASEPQWAEQREWTGAAPSEGGRAGCVGSLCENVSAPQHLLAGHK